MLLSMFKRSSNVTNNEEHDPRRGALSRLVSNGVARAVSSRKCGYKMFFKSPVATFGSLIHVVLSGLR